MMKGKCHCGNIHVEFEPKTPPEDIEVRECSCSFCRQHGSRNVTDHEGKLSLRITDMKKVNRYRFGMKLTDFWICTNCGAYVAASVEKDGKFYSTLNIKMLENPGVFARTAQSVDYSGETPERRLDRRIRFFTPTEIVAG